MVNFNIYDITDWTINTIHILPSISRSKGNQTIKFGQLVEYNMINIFLEKSYTKFGGEVGPRAFCKKSKLSISLDQQSKILYSLFSLLCPSRGLPKYIKTKVLTTYVYLI